MTALPGSSTADRSTPGSPGPGWRRGAGRRGDRGPAGPSWVTDAGRAVISFTLVGADYYPSAAYAGLDLKSGAGPVRVAAKGKGVSDGFTSYKAFVGDPPRTGWGDYGAAVAGGNSIWIANEYIDQSCTLTEWSANAGPQLGSCGGTRTALANWASASARSGRNR